VEGGGGREFQMLWKEERVGEVGGGGGGAHFPAAKLEVSRVGLKTATNKDVNEPREGKNQAGNMRMRRRVRGWWMQRLQLPSAAYRRCASNL
jgi:hypothetical protein